MELLDFDLSIRAKAEGRYAVSVDHSPGGEANVDITLPFEGLQLENQLQKLEIALLARSSGRRRVDVGNDVTKDFGQVLYDSVFAGEVRNVLDLSRASAAQSGRGLRVRLSVEAADLVGLPWEFMYDQRAADYMALSGTTPIVRYLRLGQPPRPLAVEPPLRILALVASPADRSTLDTAQEQLRLETALADVIASGQVELHWVGGQSWRQLQHELRQGPWHLFHFIGHGGFDASQGEGVLAFVADDGTSQLVSATNVARLLGDHQPLRLAVLNACEGARTDGTDIFSSVATMLLRKGVPAVVGMQYEITDAGAIEIARAFYGAIADGLPVDLALTDARKAVCVALPESLDWGVPVLYTHTDDGVLFSFPDLPRRGSVAAEGPHGPDEKAAGDAVVDADGAGADPSADPSVERSGRAPQPQTATDEDATSGSSRRPRPPKPIGRYAVLAVLVAVAAAAPIVKYATSSTAHSHATKTSTTTGASTFLGNALASDQWVDDKSGAAEVRRRGSGLFVTLSPSSVAGGENGGVTTTCKFRGDFEVSVQYALQNPDDRAMLRVGLESDQATMEWFADQAGGHYGWGVNPGLIPNDVSPLLDTTPTKDTVGTISLQRVGNTLTGDYGGTQRWSFAPSSPYLALAAADTAIKLQVWIADARQLPAATPQTVRLTNFIIDQGSCA